MGDPGYYNSLLWQLNEKYLFKQNNILAEDFEQLCFCTKCIRTSRTYFKDLLEVYTKRDLDSYWSFLLIMRMIPDHILITVLVTGIVWSLFASPK